MEECDALPPLLGDEGTSIVRHKCAFIHGLIWDALVNHSTLRTLVLCGDRLDLGLSQL